MLSDGTWTYTWEHGRELASMSKSGATWSFTYDADGMRTKRTNGSTTYNYVYNGGSLVKMTVGSNTLHFAYEASGRPLAVIYNGTRYHYVTNLQGDVVQIRQGTTPVVNYTYDAWGKLLNVDGSMKDTLGVHNPLRYRGYVYDTETGLYYLQSRYYNPALGRFLNADAFASTGQGFVGNNMFAYCNNNPVAFEDISGTASKSCLYDSTEPRMPWRDSGSGGGRPYKDYSSGSNYYGKVADKFYIARFVKYITNTDEQVVLDAELFAFYRGQLVVRQDWSFTKGRSGSFLIMFLDSNETDVNVVKHEWGHYAQLKLMGPLNYALSVALPSVTSDAQDPNYYSNPWERTADWLGGVQWSNYQYKKGSLAWGLSQFVFGPVSVPLYYIFGK